MQKEIEPPAGEYGERIARGAAWLDEHQPGWRERIDMTDLDLWSCTRCVLGQLYGEFGNAPEEIYENAAFFGFDENSSPAYQARMKRLTEEWRAYIEATR